MSLVITQLFLFYFFWTIRAVINVLKSDTKRIREFECPEEEPHVRSVYKLVILFIFLSITIESHKVSANTRTRLLPDLLFSIQTEILFGNAQSSNFWVRLQLCSVSTWVCVFTLMMIFKSHFNAFCHICMLQVTERHYFRSFLPYQSQQLTGVKENLLKSRIYIFLTLVVLAFLSLM